MTSSESSVEEVPVKRKKGVINSHLYKSNAIKEAKLLGEAHINHVGKFVPAKQPATLCGCKASCLSSFSTDEKKDILQNFLKIASKNEQDLHLQRMMELQTIKRGRGRSETPESSKKPKSFSVKYFLLQRGARKNVCKEAFLSAHAISAKRSIRLSNLLNGNQSPHDNRGKNSKGGKAIPSTVVNRIHEHISYFPTNTSHYTGKETKYLNANLSVRTMFDLYKKDNPNDNFSYKFYWTYFKENFSLRFGRPAKDFCGHCEELNSKIRSITLNDNAKRAAVAELMVHKRRSRKFYQALQDVSKMCKLDTTVAGICVDFMANVSLPTIPVQDLYYLRQLTVNTFGIHDLTTENMTCFIYNEFDGHKGPNEVCTFLSTYIHKYLSEDVKTLILFCDNCGGQNKNHTLIRFLMSYVELKRFDAVSLYFPNRGHSYLPCDRDFGLIRKVIKKNERFYTLQHYQSFIEKASKNPNKFKVHLVDASHIIDFKQWWPEFYKKQSLSNDSFGKTCSSKIKFLISAYHHFHVSKDSSSEVSCKEYINGFLESKFKLRKNTTQQLTLPRDRAYPDKLPILSAKMEDIKKTMRFIPDEHHDFWNVVLELQTRVGQEDENN